MSVGDFNQVLGNIDADERFTRVDESMGKRAISASQIEHHVLGKLRHNVGESG